MTRPDFGWHEVEHEGVKLTCRYIAPGLTMSDLVSIYDEAEKKAAPNDHLAGDPSKWPITRGVSAVTEAILNAVYGPSADAGL
jgi:hypothetical protein